MNPNIALVLTHQDSIQAKDPKEYVNFYIDDILHGIEGKPYSDYISKDNIYVVDNKTGSEEDFSLFRQNLLQMFRKQRSWGIERPIRWLKLEADIRERAEANKAPYLFMHTVNELAATCGMTSNEVQSFLQFQHGMGDFVYFSDTALKNILITDPKWLLDTFKVLITAHEFLDKRKQDSEIIQQLKKGVVTKMALNCLWQNESVKLKIAMMTKLNLLMPLQSLETIATKFLIPSMLPNSTRNMYQNEPFKTMKMVYSSTHLAADSENIQIGTYHRLLVRLSNKTEWKLCEKDHLSYTDSSFQVQKGIRLAISELECKINISMWANKNISQTSLREILPNVIHNCSAALLHVSICESDKFLILCPHSTAEDGEYDCLVRVKMELGNKVLEYERCPIHERHVEMTDYSWLEETCVCSSLVMLCKGKT